MIFVVEMMFQKNADDLPENLERQSNAYWTRLAERGVLLGGGPWPDGSGRMLLCEAPDRAALLRVLHEDPLARSHLVAQVRVREWNLVMGHALLSAAEGDDAGEAAPAPVPHGGSRTAGARTHARRALGFFAHPENGERRRPESEVLTPHEERIARMMIDGMTNRKIAERLSVSTRAVELHITRIYRKLAIKRRAQLAIALAQSPDAA